MNLKRSVLLFFALVLLLTAAGAALAQTTLPDGDRDGVPDKDDRCPDTPGSPNNGGCPLDRPADDRDSDGVADFVDQCPDAPGSGFTNGCPIDVTPIIIPDQNQNPQVVMIWSDMSQCMIGVPLSASDPVNVRETPTISAPVIGQLFPGDQFAPWFRDYDENGDVWFGGAPAGESYGWVKDEVVIDNGMCVNLPMVIHVDAPGDPAIEIDFDPSIIPEIDPDSDGNWWENLPPESLINLTSGGLIVDPTPQVTPTLVPTIAPPKPFRFLLGSEALNLGSHNVIIAVLDPETEGDAPGAPIDGFFILPEFGDGEGQCSDPNEFLGGLQDFTGQPDTTSILIGLLLPAVQKVREAANRWVGTEELLASHFFVMGNHSDAVPHESMSLNFTRVSNCDTWVFVPSYLPDGSLMTETLADGSVILCLVGFYIPGI